MAYDDPSFNTGYVEGVGRFQSARMKAFWQEMVSLLSGKPIELMSFEDIRNRLRLSEESYKGLQDIEIEKIAGSVGRYRDFTNNFLPRRGEMQERWSRVYAKANSMSGLPPIEVYKVGDVYFVRDGNHRVSVARQLKTKTIQAYVTELHTPISLHQNISAAELDEATAYAEFLAETELRRTRPHHQSMQLSEPSRYGEMMQHIYLQKQILEQIETREVSLYDAASHWYDNIYRPALTLIRKYEILESLPPRKEGNPRTEGDLYLWLVGHLHQVQEEYGEAGAKTYSDALVDFLAQKKVSVPEGLFHEEGDAALITKTRTMRALNRYDNTNRPFSGDNSHIRKHTA